MIAPTGGTRDCTIFCGTAIGDGFRAIDDRPYMRNCRVEPSSAPSIILGGYLQVEFCGYDINLDNGIKSTIIITYDIFHYGAYFDYEISIK